MCMHTMRRAPPLAVLQVALRRGTARSYDHSQLVHAQWLHLAELGVQAHVLRVSTDDNVADLPSRLDFDLLEACGAIYVAPKLLAKYEAEEAWAVLQERWQVLPSMGGQVPSKRVVKSCQDV